MKIWVRSQDKEVLTICTELCVGGTYGNEIIADAGCPLGKYKTKSRALEVLDEIQKLLKTAEINNCFNVIVYEMPKE